MAKTTAKPAKGSTTKTSKGGHYTPPNASRELPPSCRKPLNSKGTKKNTIPDD